MTDKGKQLVQGTRQVRENDSEEESNKMKKCKVSRRLLRVVILDTEDEDGQPSRGTIIVVKSSKVAVPQTPAPAKNVKQLTPLKAIQAGTKARTGRTMPKEQGGDTSAAMLSPQSIVSATNNEPQS
ncbi:uncharacterized protein EDB93DRAFT_1102508 [Suillus bovinus]|uniref:uncharacterized protein n=1 Tax=Suillus bovinus TaxID=48563 RepID=UPI001B867FA5|nr:uncharacterized protein EDB93DRAFT_1102508 [Suillus bovinus]KAG2153691.1 hypothetical protein EDB93DRAFT_1102508 [Suillus bovinus]